MSPQDASFLHIEDDVTHMHVGFAAIFEGPAPEYAEIEEMVRGKLPLVPRYRQKVRFVPFDVGRPVWVDDPHFNLEFHLRHTALPPPGGNDELRNLIGRVMSQQLDRSKPLWEMWIVHGLGGERWALVSKVHHCMVDGVAATDLMTVLLDRRPDPSPPEPDDWAPESEPSDVRLASEAWTDLATQPYEQLRGWRSAGRSARKVAEQLAGTVRGSISMGRLATPPSLDTSLNGPIGPHRRWDWARVGLDDVKTVRNACTGTVNDVVLTLITRGFRDLLLERGEPVHDRVVRTLVPVSTRRPEERGTYNNRVSAMFADLPVGIADPQERLRSVREQMDELKQSGQAVAGEVLSNLSGFAPPMLLALGARAASRFPQRNVNTVTTNVPGPKQTLYAAGRPMVEVFPVVPVGGEVRIGVAIFSYQGQLNFGVTGDWESAPDIGVLCRGVEAGMDELLSAVGQAPARKPARRRPAARAGRARPAARGA